MVNQQPASPLVEVYATQTGTVLRKTGRLGPKPAQRHRALGLGVVEQPGVVDDVLDLAFAHALDRDAAPVQPCLQARELRGLGDRAAGDLAQLDIDAPLRFLKKGVGFAHQLGVEPEAAQVHNQIKMVDLALGVAERR